MPAPSRRLLCRLFGHKANAYGHDAPYGEIAGGAEDGIGRQHWWVTLKCTRCRARYVAANFHANRISDLAVKRERERIVAALRAEPK